MSKIEFPLHKFNLPAFKAWQSAGVGRRAMARALNRIYPGRTVGVISPQPLHLVAVVSSGGEIQDLARPYRTVKFWDLANQPSAGNCICQTFTDPENSHLPWSARQNLGSERHHPLCQYDPAAAPAFQTLYDHGRPHHRPDGWTYVNDAVRERLGLETQHRKLQVAVSSQGSE